MFLQILFVFAAALLLSPFAVVQADDDGLNANSIYFSYIGKPSCTADQKKKIVRGWNDAITLAKYAKDAIDWTGAAELEFLGPTRYNQDYHNNVGNIFKNAATFERRALFPPPFWFVYISCADWKSSCTRGKKAYTHNVDYSTGLVEQKDDPSATMRITFCEEFFRYDSLKHKIDEGIKLPNDVMTKWDLGFYKNGGYIVLHEMMHGNVVAYTPNGDRHIKDLQQLMRRVDRPDDQFEWFPCYGPELTKVMARTQTKYLGEYITTNADSLAVYALAKYVGNKLGAYPYLPVVTHESEGSPVPRFGTYFVQGQDGLLYVNMTTATARNTTFDVDDNLFYESQIACSDLDDGDCDNVDVIQVDTWNDDSVYPADYINQRNTWLADIDAAGGQPLTVDITVEPPIGDISLECTGDDEFREHNSTVDVASALTSIKDYCKTQAGSTFDGSSYRNTQSYSIPNSGSRLWLGTFLNKGECPSSHPAIDKTQCVAGLISVINGCDTSTIYLKHGGSKTTGCLIWAVEITEGGP